jgi:hypothetical protein
MFNNLTIGTTFGAVSGLLTAIGLILSSYGEHINIHILIIMLLSLSFSNGISDAIGIYYSSYVNDKDYNKAVREAVKTLVVNALIPFTFAVVFILIKNVKYGSYINIILAFALFMYLNMKIFIEPKHRLFNFIIFMLVIGGNYLIGKSKFN